MVLRKKDSEAEIRSKINENFNPEVQAKEVKDVKMKNEEAKAASKKS